MSNPIRSTVQSYYDSLESRIGYRLFLGGTRHFGYYEAENAWPWPISPALRAMEEKMFQALKCKNGSKILDAGCGAGFVALYMARRGGYNIEAIDLTPHHVVKTDMNIRAAGMSKQMSVRQADYHDLDAFPDADFDGVYTMETLVHASRPREVLKEFLRVLKPGGSLVMHEYEHVGVNDAPKYLVDEIYIVNRIAGMVGFEQWEIDDLQKLVREVGFQKIEVTDMTKNIVPMLWLFYIVAYIPYLILRFLGVQYHFINTTSAVRMYQGRKYWKYIQIKAIK